jgi:hypothetical protein
MTTTGGTTTVAYTRDALDRITERKVNGTTIARYVYGSSADTPVATLDASGNLLERTLSVPGGVTLTIRPAGNVWSYPNLHGDIAATASQTGVKNGTTATFDPNGNQTSGTTADNATGNFDNRWLGQYQRPTETEPGLEPIIEMGARQYSPRLGRFLETDPVTGGSANAYAYTFGDPTNTNDITGKCPECGFLAFFDAYFTTYPQGNLASDLHNPGSLAALAPAPEKNSRNGSTGDAGSHPYPGWARFMVEAAVASMTSDFTFAVCAATSGIGCPAAFLVSYVIDSTAVYVMENPGQTSWSGWGQSLRPQNSMKSWERWPPW